MRDICNRHGALLILDEVMCGMGRTGTLACVGAGGHRARYPGCSPRDWAAAISRSAPCSQAGRSSTPSAQGSGAFQHGHTYLAHPMACAAALGVQQVIREERLLDRVKDSGRSSRTAADRAVRQSPACRRHSRARPVPGDRTGGRSRHADAVRSRTQAPSADQGLRRSKRGLACYPMGGTVDGLTRRSCPARAAVHRNAREYRHDRRPVGPCRR